MLDAEKTNEKGRKKEKKPLPSPITEYTLPEWLTKSELYDIRKLRDYPIFELHEELVYLEKWLEPTNFDKFIRQTVIEDVTAVTKGAARVGGVSLCCLFDELVSFLLLLLSLGACRIAIWTSW